jgi:alpha-ribazole phosphatase
MHIYLIRHTEVAVGRGICYGQADVPLADNFAAQRDRLRALLPDQNIPITLFSSPLSRCRLLAETIRDDIAAGTIGFDGRLLELNFGRWEMQPWASIPAAELDGWMADFVTNGPPDGESFRQLADRVGAFWQERIVPMALRSADPASAGPGAGPVLIVAHGGVIRALLCLVLGLPLQNAYRLHLDYGSLCRLRLTINPANEPVYLIESINR